ncbi:MAG: phosphocarrier protein HPr [Alphaproteobacteria bacterium]|jgi:phosphocarrier protein HPr
MANKTRSGTGGEKGSSDSGDLHTRKAVITGQLGLHARPAARFVKLAVSFESVIEVTANGVTVSGGSIMGLMMLGAGDGTELLLTAIGPDAEVALDALEGLVAQGFA